MDHKFIYGLVCFGLIFCKEDCPSSDHNSRSNLYVKEHQNYIMNFERATRLFEKVACKNCSFFDRVIENDLQPFQSGIDQEMIRRASLNGVKYQVINHELYRMSKCVFPSRCEGVDYFLNKIRNELPDIEFIVNFHDWPQISKHFSDMLPVFSFSKTNTYLDIMYPAWSFWKGGPAIKIYPQGIGKWNGHRLKIIKAAEKWPWSNKSSTAFFRGSRTSSERDNLVLLSRAEPDLVNAAYTKNQAWKSEKDTLGLAPADEIPLEEHCKFRYLFNFRGVAASFRLKYLFLCKSLVLHVGDEWKEFFYDSLKPWVHYVPIRSDSTQEEIKKLLLFLKAEDRIAQDIASRGFDFIYNNLKIHSILNYWKTLLLHYKKLMTYEPELDEILIKVS